MCNLYRMTPKDDLESFIRRRGGDLFYTPDYGIEEPIVVPFRNGLFLHFDASGSLVGKVGQWGMIRPNQPSRIEYLDRFGKVLPPDSAIKGKARSTNNARSEGIEKKNTYSIPWRQGKRCLIPADWYREPNWETKKNIWWDLKRQDGDPWMLAGLWNEWTDLQTGEVVYNYAMVTMNCTGHPLLGRLHRDEIDPKTKEVLPAHKQDKRSVVQIDPADWEQWLRGTEQEARALLRLQPSEVFDQADAVRTDEALQTIAAATEAKAKAAAPTPGLF